MSNASPHALVLRSVSIGCVLLLAAGCGEPAPGSGRWVRAEVADATERLSATEGGRRILEVIDAQGGLEAWYSAPTSAYSWEYSNLGSNMRFDSYLVADNRTRQVYHDLRTYGTPEQVEEVDATFAWNGEEAWISPGERRQPNPRFWSLTGYYFQSIPFVLADPGINLEVLPPEDLPSGRYERVMAYFDTGVGDSPGDLYVVYIDPDTGQVAALLYTVTFGSPYEPPPGPPAPPPSGTILFYEDYTTVDGLTVPTHFTGYAYRDGTQEDQRSEAWVSEISFREPFDASRLQMPEDGRIAPYDVD